MCSDRKRKNDRKDPGASRYGSFINYYQFHPVDERVGQLPRGVWRSQHPDRKYIALDVGCNAGNLTSALKQFIKNNLEPDIDVHILGIDLDSTLIERARENYPEPNVKFQCLDFFSKESEHVLTEYLQQFERTRFDVVFCFSITMWIHLNHGDEGLIKFLEDICFYSEMVVIEPQLWKCYRNASRRLRRADEGDFPLINELKMTGDMERHIERIICCDKCNFQKINITKNNNWGRKLLIFQRKS
ncbi:pre-miRNA 5'-monophosphate methyltransferase isoform X2 [Chelonus insularis]|uniref:pre-miRNA 5'-monophosphate methyltransferase isoform X2 n=2 Tax=Chelonus insularis TaxID=460826 RepID=UPI00158AB299|nr:pre-miRNA 5'-monophosphate methyltransferase isoform X2 [Chelonus insularis]XP_034938476.1 pre-miRNA 5'-monophosphate methyltransferase isoform X2 [Chelonus insularis]XP_034938477.1 pre-miRNA 5'-monophosphate methyltransferase isoform X2 [Chelonus insularis]